MDIIEKAQILLSLPEESKAKLTILQENCLDEFKRYCNREDIPVAAESVILGMMQVQYNQLGAQGLSSQSYSGINESYTDGYPQSIIKQLNSFRKLRAI